MFEFLEEGLLPEAFYQRIPFERGLGLILVVNQFKEGMLEPREDVFSLLMEKETFLNIRSAPNIPTNSDD